VDLLPKLLDLPGQALIISRASGKCDKA